MFIDDLHQVKQTFKNIFKEVGAFAVDYSGFNDEVAEHFGDYFTFQCVKDALQEYCRNHNIDLKETQDGRAIYTYINGNKYFALNERK